MVSFNKFIMAIGCFLAVQGFLGDFGLKASEPACEETSYRDARIYEAVAEEFGLGAGYGRQSAEYFMDQSSIEQIKVTLKSLDSTAEAVAWINLLTVDNVDSHAGKIFSSLWAKNVTLEEKSEELAIKLVFAKKLDLAARIGKDKCSLLHHAVLHGLTRVAKVLVALDKKECERDPSRASLIESKDGLGNPLIYYAAASKKVSMCELVVDFFRCDINAKGARDRSVLSAAAFHGNVEMLEYLLSKGACGLADIDADRKTPLDYAKSASKKAEDGSAKKARIVANIAWIEEQLGLKARK